MTARERNGMIGGAVVAAAVVGLVSLSVTSAPIPKWKPKPGRLYPRLIQARNQSDEDYAKMMDGLAKTNVVGTTRWVRETP